MRKTNIREPCARMVPVRADWGKLQSREFHHTPFSITILPISDARGKVFGLMGLVIDNHIESDYSLSVKEVFICIASFLAQHGRFSDVLDHVSPWKACLTLPSWVPDWTYRPPPISAYQISEALLRHHSFHEHRYKRHVIVSGFNSELDQPSFVIDRFTACLQVQGVRFCNFAK